MPTSRSSGTPRNAVFGKLAGTSSVVKIDYDGVIAAADELIRPQDFSLHSDAAFRQMARA